MRTAVATVLILLSWSVEASWVPTFSKMYVQLRPGESTTLTARATWSGLMPIAFAPMTFAAEDPAVAVVEGSLPNTAPAEVHITAIRPGLTRIRLDSPGLLPLSPLIAVADRGLAVNIAVAGSPLKGEPMTLVATSDDPQASFTWYEGTPDTSSMWQVASGAEFTFVPSAAIVYQYWVLATSPGAAGTATVVLDVRQPPRRQRAVRH